MSQRPSNFRLCVLLALSIGLLSADSALAKGKPPKDDPPPSNLPAVRYEIHVIPTPPGAFWINVYGLNNDGMMVGRYWHPDGELHCFLYDLLNGFYELNAEPSLLEQVEDQVGEGGWSFGTARAINDAGEFVGIVVDPEYAATPGSGRWRPYVVKTVGAEPLDWTVKVLDFPEVAVSVSGRDINDHGDVLCRYDKPDSVYDYLVVNWWLNESPVFLDLPDRRGAAVINNVVDNPLTTGGQVAGYLDTETGFLFDVQSEQRLEFALPHGGVTGLNDDRFIAGSLDAEAVYRYSIDGDQLQIIYTSRRNEESMGQIVGTTQAINANGDVFFLTWDNKIGAKRKNPGTLYLNHVGFAPGDPQQLWQLNDLIAADDPLRDFWLENRQSSYTMTDRANTDDASGYPQFAAAVGTDGEVGVVLTPFIPAD